MIKSPTKRCPARPVCVWIQSWIFIAGANGMMIGNYLTTDGRNAEIDLQMISDLGLEMNIK